MSPAAQVLAALLSGGVQVAAVGDRLHLRGRLTQELVELARLHKPALLKLLAEPASAGRWWETPRYRARNRVGEWSARRRRNAPRRPDDPDEVN